MGIAVVGRFYIQLFSAFEPTQCATKPSIVEHNNNVHNLADVMGFTVKTKQRGASQKRIARVMGITVKRNAVLHHRNALLTLWALL